MSESTRRMDRVLWDSAQLNAGANTYSLFAGTSLFSGTANDDLHRTNVRNTKFMPDLLIEGVSWEIFMKPAEGDLEELAQAFALAGHPSAEMIACHTALGGILALHTRTGTLDLCPMSMGLRSSAIGAHGELILRNPIPIERQAGFSFSVILKEAPIPDGLLFWCRVILSTSMSHY